MRERRLNCRQAATKAACLLRRILLGVILMFLGGQPQAFSDQISSPREEATYLRWDDVKCSDARAPECYAELYCNIHFKLKKPGEWESLRDCRELLATFDLSHQTMNGYSRYTMRMHRHAKARTKPSTVVVSIHGLWGDSTQFDSVLSVGYFEISSGMPNRIDLTLPGHMKDGDRRDAKYLNAVRERKPFATHDRWLKALDETLELARHMGEKTIVIGQSTGGLLAVIAAIRHPDKVDEIVLVEPALRVRPLLNFGACLSAAVPDVVLKALGALVGVAVPDGVSLKMGCEVQKLADGYFPRPSSQHTASVQDSSIYGSDYASDYGSGLSQLEDFSVYERVASRIHVPVLMINNEHDEIVSVTANRHFFKGLRGPKKYVSINVDGKSPHGAILSGDANGIASLLSEFSFENLPTSQMGQLYAYRTIREFESRVRIPGLVGDSVGVLRANALARSNSTPEFLRRLKPVFLRLMPDPAEFEKLSFGLRAVNDSWVRAIERAASTGAANGNEVDRWLEVDQSDEAKALREQGGYLFSLSRRLYEAL